MSVGALCALAVCASVTALFLRELRPEMARLLAIAASLLIMGAAAPMAAEFVAEVRRFTLVSRPMARFIMPMLKVTGLAYVAQFAAELCRDAGESALAGRVELLGKTAIALISFPMVRDVFLSLTEFI